MTRQHKRNTWLEPEEAAYPNGGMTRKGAALFPDEKVRRVYVGVADTVWTAPAYSRVRGKYIRGYVEVKDDVLHFVPHRHYANLFMPFGKLAVLRVRGFNDDMYTYYIESGGAFKEIANERYHPSNWMTEDEIKEGWVEEIHGKLGVT